MDVDSANIVTDLSNGEHNKPEEINQKPQAIEKTSGNKLIVHYTHEKRFYSLKREIHQIYRDVFKNTPVEDLKLIVGTRNRRDARNDLIRKRPQRALLQNKQRKSKCLKTIIRCAYLVNVTFTFSSYEERKRHTQDKLNINTNQTTFPRPITQSIIHHNGT